MTLLQQVAEVEALRAKATPGEWSVSEVECDGYDEFDVTDAQGRRIVDTFNRDNRLSLIVDEEHVKRPYDQLSYFDAAFIAACGSLDFTAIRMELERLTRENQELRQHLSYLDSQHPYSMELR